MKLYSTKCNDIFVFNPFSTKTRLGKSEDYLFNVSDPSVSVRKLQELHNQMIHLQSLSSFVSYKKYSGAMIILIDDSNRSFSDKNKLRRVFKF